MTTTIAVMQPYFVPYAGYFRLFAATDLFVIYDCVQFPRRGWVHRNQLPGANGQPNWLTLPFLGFGLVANGLAHGLSGLSLSFLGLILCSLVPWLLFHGSGGGAIGGGDVKLAAAIGALTGPTVGLEIEFMALLALVFWALVRLTYQGKLSRVLLNVVVLLTNPFRARARATGRPLMPRPGSSRRCRR